MKPFPDLNGARVLAIRLRSIGDALLMTPSLHAIKRQYPDSSLSVLVEPSAAGIFQGNPDIDAVIVVAGKRQCQGSSLSRRYRYLKSIIQIYNQRFTAVFDFHGGPRSGILTWLSNAAVRVGHRDYQNSWAYTHKVGTDTKRDSIHSVERQLSLVTGVGIPPAEKNLVLNVSQAARQFLTRRQPDLLQASTPIIAFHLWSHTQKKTWPASETAKVANSFIATHNARILLLGSPNEQSQIDSVAALLTRQPTIFCGDEFGLQELAAVLEKVKLYIGNDSGPTHMAAALRLPIVVLFGGSNPAVWHPWTDRYILLHQPQPCAPCRGPAPCKREFACIRGIQAEQVIAAGVKLLEGSA